MWIAQASETSQLSNPAPTAAAASNAHVSRSPFTLFASQDQLNSVNFSTRYQENRSSLLSSNTRSKQPENSNSSKQFAQSLSRDNLSAHNRFTAHKPPLYSSPTDVMSVSQSAQLNRSSSKPNSTVCFKFGKPGHISSTCSNEVKPPLRCYACRGFKHLSRNSSSPSRKQPVQPAESKPKSSNAVSSAATGTHSCLRKQWSTEWLFAMRLSTLALRVRRWALRSTIVCRRAPRSTRLRTRLYRSSESAARVPKSKVISTYFWKSPESKSRICCWSSRIFHVCF